MLVYLATGKKHDGVSVILWEPVRRLCVFQHDTSVQYAACQLNDLLVTIAGTIRFRLLRRGRRFTFSFYRSVLTKLLSGARILLMIFPYMFVQAVKQEIE